MITALTLAFGAALFTVLGFRELFEPSLKITFMAASIEVGKIVAVSAIYQFRSILSMIWKGILFSMIIIAMAVTSMGVYGYLSSSYQKDSLSVTTNDARTTLLDSRKVVLTDRLAGMDTQIENVPEAYVSKRMELIETFKPERQSIITELDELEQKKLDLTLERIEKETEFGAILLLSKSIEGLESSKAMLYFILAVIFIFDPMAISLTYAANVGYHNAANRPKEEKVIPEKVIPEVEDDNKDELISKIDSLIESSEVNKKESKDAIDSITDSVEKVSKELTALQEQEPKDKRASVVDNMRNQT